MSDLQLSPADLAMLQAQGNQAPLAAPSAQDLAMLQPAALYQQPAANPDAAYLTAPQPAATPTPQDLAAMSNSDPNGLTSADVPAQGAAAPMQNPATLGAGSPGQDPTPANANTTGISGNPATNPYTPDGAADQGGAGTAPQQTPAFDETGKPTKGFRAWVNENDLLQKGQSYPVTHVNKLAEIYAEGLMRAKATPSPQIVTANGHPYMLLGNNTPVDLDKEPKFHQAQLADGTLGQVDASTGKFAPFTDGNGQPIKGKLGGQADAMNAVSAMANNQQLQTLQTQAADLTAKLSSGQKQNPHFWQDQTPYAQQLVKVQSQIAALNSPQAQAVAPTAAAAAPSAPVVTGPDDYAKLPVGAQFVFNGQTLTKKGQ